MNERQRYEKLDLNNKLIWNLRDTGRTMRRTSEGRGSQKRVLIVLLETGRITQKALTERLGIQPGSASEVIGKLEAAGMLCRAPSEDDRRTSDIVLTDEGRAAAEEAAAQRRARHEDMFACLCEEEKATLLGLLERLNDSWAALYPEGEGAHLEHKSVK